MMKRLAGLTALPLLLAAITLGAQPVTKTAASPNRAALERQFRERTAKVAQQKLGLTDAQLAKLEETSARYAPQLNQLVVQERDTRRQLRLEMTSGNQANQQHVSDLLDNTVRLQKQRIALVEAEQKDLAGFLTPIQRARYVALQAQFRNRAQELSRGNGARAGARQRGDSGLRKRPAAKRLP
jgi:Spy/CpxP family protein refolding chaperone